jgi:hypothetical protein
MENGLDGILQGMYALICQASSGVLNRLLSPSSIGEALDTLVSLACALLALPIHLSICQLCAAVR